jgi:alanine racemase
MNHPSAIQLSQSALAQNFRVIRQLVGLKVQISSVVKGNAYGHGIENFVPMVAACGIHHFCVHSYDEALRVKKALFPSTATVVVMGFVDDADLPECIAQGIEFFVFDTHRLAASIQIAEQKGVAARIHLELETGFHRTGIESKALEEIARVVNSNQAHVQVKGICTHYAGAESIANHVRVQQQWKHFSRMADQLKVWGIDAPRHTACSAAAVAYPKTRMDMVRIGIMQYGFWPSRESLIHFLKSKKNGLSTDPLCRVITWKSQVLSIKQVDPGDFVGYGTSYLVQHPMKLASVPVGYSHGYSRTLSNLGRVVVNGRPAPVVGLVNMNMMMVDVTEHEGVSRGDEVLLIGGKSPAEVSVASFGELSNQLNYELLTRLPVNIPRKITD